MRERPATLCVVPDPFVALIFAFVEAKLVALRLHPPMATGEPFFSSEG
jgi:hypothetical protein